MCEDITASQSNTIDLLIDEEHADEGCADFGHDNHLEDVSVIDSVDRLNFS